MVTFETDRIRHFVIQIRSASNNRKAQGNELEEIEIVPGCSKPMQQVCSDLAIKQGLRAVLQQGEENG